MPRIIDADGHVLERAGIEGINKYMPRGSQSGAIFPALDHHHGQHLKPPAEDGGDAQAGQRVIDRKAWMDFLEETRIEWSVLYPTSGLAEGRIVSEDWAVAACRAYNNWLYDNFTDNSDNRLKGMALVPVQNPDAAAVELRRAVKELGFVGAMLPSNGEGIRAHYGNRMYDPLFAEAQSLNCALAVHGGSHHHFGGIDTYSVYYPVNALGHPFGIMVQAAGMISHGTFEKFPGLRVAYLEGGSSWVPFFMDRMDRAYGTSHFEVDLEGNHLPGPNPNIRPSDYIKQKIESGNIFIGFDVDDEGLGDAVKRAGRKPFLYATDFPHESHDAELCIRESTELLEREDLTREDKEAIIATNAERFYGVRS
jgi:predicted TIM-barrel fold metal-dependent hydrolase